MKLGDLFWVKTLKLKREDDEYKDTIKVMAFVREKFDIDLTFVEAYTLWRRFSDSWCAGWLILGERTLEGFENYLNFELGGE